MSGLVNLSVVRNNPFIKPEQIFVLETHDKDVTLSLTVQGALKFPYSSRGSVYLGIILFSQRKNYLMTVESMVISHIHSLCR